MVYLLSREVMTLLWRHYYYDVMIVPWRHDYQEVITVSWRHGCTMTWLAWCHDCTMTSSYFSWSKSVGRFASWLTDTWRRRAVRAWSIRRLTSARWEFDRPIQKKLTTPINTTATNDYSQQNATLLFYTAELSTKFFFIWIKFFDRIPKNVVKFENNVIYTH